MRSLIRRHHPSRTTRRVRPSRRARPAAAAAAVAALLTAGLGTAAVAPAAASPAHGTSAAGRAHGTASAAATAFTAKGPVGWDTLRRLDAFDTLPQGVRTRQFSSFDRAQRNNDQGNCLRSIGQAGCVMAEATGAGEIDSIWLTSITNGSTGDVSDLGNLVIVLDGTTVVNAPLQSVVDGSLGAPFVFPLVADAAQSSGGVSVNVPMPYTSSMLVYTTATPNPDYFHVDYRTFADADGVTRFDPGDTASDVLAMLKAAGTADPKPAQSGATTTTTPVSLAPGGSAQIASVAGPGTLTALHLDLPQLAAPPSQLDPADDGRAFGSGGSSTFTVAIDPANRGVRLTRRLDASIANQVADVVVGGTVVGRWTGLPQSSGDYADQSVDLPASLTAGKSQITVTNRFVSSSLDFNEFAYWADSLGQGGYHRTDTVDVGNAASESAHAYAVTGQTWSGTRGQGALHYAPHSVPQITDDGRAFGSGGSSRFTVAIDPSNTGVRLTRRLDSGIANQVASVSVDGTPVGQWSGQPTNADGQLWTDQHLDLPASVTAGKSHITVTNTFVSSPVDFNEFTYWADATVSGRQVRTDTVDVGNAASESAHAYAVTGQTWNGTRTYGYVPDAVLDSEAILRGTRIRISFDGSRTVDAPLGEFFGSAGYEGQVRSLMTGMDPGGAGLTAWWPMPYGSNATVTLVNGSPLALTGASASVTAAPCADCAAQLSAGAIGYFHATSNATSAAAMVDGKDYRILQAAGHGKFAGVALGMTGPGSPAYARDYLEGNERVYVDGAATPNPVGTGTEDYFSSGWYFTDGPYTLPFTGNPSHQAGTYGCPDSTDCTSAYRLTVQDAVVFDSSLTYGIEHGFNFDGADHGHGDDVAASYTSTAFWYGQSAASARTTDVLDVGDPAAESAHAYTQSGPGTLAGLTATYEGNDGTPTPVTTTGRKTTSAASFTLAVDPANTGVTLRRSSDQTAGYQRAAIAVDGAPAGTWLEPLGSSVHRLLDDSFQLPPALTAGKSHITVTVTPASGAPAWSATRYEAVSAVAPFTDTAAPSAVTATVARATGTGGVGVTWTPATDDTAVDHYAVYAAQNAAPAIGPATLVGTTPVPSFTHTGPAAGQNWHYRVAAVDAAGNTGTPSPDTAVTVAAPVKIEGESLTGSATGTATVSGQPNCCGVTWSGNAQLWVQANAAGQYATVTFSVPAAGRYDLSAVMTLAPDYGVAAVAVDGTRLGAAFDGYAPAVQISDPQDYGALDLTAGTHTLTVTAQSKAPWSANYLAGVDYLLLSPSS